MDEKADNLPFFWEEESQEPLSVPMKMKRKVRPKKIEFVGWGSKPLIEFLESIGKDTSKQISQYEVAAIITEYVNAHNLVHPQKKKRILCDERLYTLFGRKSVVRIKIYDLLETHFAENQDESMDDFFYSSEENDENSMMVGKRQKTSSSDRKNLHQKEKVPETPKSCFMAIVPENIKLVYLKRSLVQDLLKVPETFEGKVVGSFVRVKSDPYDYLQKNSHQLVQVRGVRKSSGTGKACTEILLQVSNMMKDVDICMLSEDNFSEEECEDLRQRVKSGSFERPMVVEFQQKAQMLHEDITKHWLARELILLQNLIDRANEKGWRKELFEYLERKQLLQTPSEQSRLLLEIPKVIADEIEQEATPQEGSNGSPRSILKGASDISTGEANQTSSTQNFGGTDAAGSEDVVITSKLMLRDSALAREDNEDFTIVDASNKEPKEDQPAQFVQQQKKQYINWEDCKDYQGWIDKQVAPTLVIEVSNDDEVEDPGGRDQILGDHPGRLVWHYLDPQGDIQGPFSMESLKRWSDANYFPPDFKVWKTGQSQYEAVILSDVLLRM